MNNQVQNPPARAVSCAIGGTIISGSNLAHSILLQNVYIDGNSIVEDSILFDNVKVGINSETV